MCTYNIYILPHQNGWIYILCRYIQCRRGTFETYVTYLDHEQYTLLFWNSRRGRSTVIFYFYFFLMVLKSRILFKKKAGIPSSSSSFDCFSLYFVDRVLVNVDCIYRVIWVFCKKFEIDHLVRHLLVSEIVNLFCVL